MYKFTPLLKLSDEASGAKVVSISVTLMLQMSQTNKPVNSEVE